MRHYGHYIDGQEIAPAGGEHFPTDNPYTGKTWAMIARYDLFAAGLKVVGQTTPAPGLPWIAAKGTDADRLFPILAAAVAALPADDKATLCLKGLTRIPAEAYLAIPTPPPPADPPMRSMPWTATKVRRGPRGRMA